MVDHNQPRSWTLDAFGGSQVTRANWVGQHMPDTPSAYDNDPRVTRVDVTRYDVPGDDGTPL